MNLCGCKYAQVDNGGGKSITYCFWCRLHKRATDPNLCGKCADKDDGKVKKHDALEREH